MNQLYIGLMSGTSLDGVDVILAEFRGDTPLCLATHTAPYPDQIRDALLDLCRPQAPIEKVMELDVRLGRMYAREIQRLLDRAGVPARHVEAIGSHGQTLRHLPEGDFPATLQIGDPNIVAQLTGITTVADFRRRDMAAGGQGAPLVPAFHQVLFGRRDEKRVVVNIGGIANITILAGGGDDSVSGFDTGPGNVLMDSWAARHLGTPMDRDGTWAASGTADPELLEEMLRDPFFRLAPPKSTGREYFNLEWIHARPRTAILKTADVAATLCELTATSIAEAVRRHAPRAERIIACGGGVHNKTLMQRLRILMAPCTVESSAEQGLHPDWVEAAAFAWLARQTLRDRSGNLPSVTGAGEAVVLGGIYPGTQDRATD